jgi:hypothetical protein
MVVQDLYFDGDVKTISFTGADVNEVEIQQTNGAGNLTDTLDLSNFNGKFLMDTNAGINHDVHTINVGNLLDGSVINVQSGVAAGDAQTYHFGAELDNDITIGTAGGPFNFDGVAGNSGNGTGAAGLNADVLDLSALGVTALSDLSITYSDVDGDGNDDATIGSSSGAFDGHIILVGIADGELTAANFHFA